MNKVVNKNRIIGERIGGKPGPLMIVFAQIHGNEPAGYKAVQELFKAIDAEYIKNPKFEFCGRIVALLGNMKAAAANVRYIEKDLNRSWLPQEINRIRQIENIADLDAEDQEIKENLELIDAYIDLCQPPRVVVLDLHTTTAHGGIFTIPSQNPEARRIGLNMHAPVLHGFLDGLKGTTLHYFSQENFEVDMNAVCFEAGQHQSEDSYKHAVSAIIQCFKSIGGFYAKDIENKHDQLLEERSKGLPLEAKLMYVHQIKPDDNFKMIDSKVYSNFDPIEKGEILAYDKNGPVCSPYDGLILMPLYQQQGSDGFFVIQEITARSKEEQNSNPVASNLS
ncbi:MULTISPECIES: succinylglutamate desuccinylase/aspartoacylase family protein [unclassified Aureispira]|uniref:succinylglutamate desuccinylase/aspartoacylase family protein n=1 Tax=unclassified Aureispira TaxID=2649989 RepID=UPI000695CF0C|nr:MULTISPECIES: succinylglutamate desuccinylase/aspartoacylase family protein [unclassified Aureispira]WMX16811.1 succinylglutamate desuccinylase/aspartoacylase family protein [Aureispira sp. CCB-E]